MTDTAQLREALDAMRVSYPSDATEIAFGDALKLICDAARELLTLREAGALIIVPDEKDGRWPIEVIAGMAGTFYAVREQGGTLTDIFIGQLDALRDAMPDRGSE